MDTNQELDVFIKKSRAAGQSDMQIKDVLLTAMWKEKDIDVALKAGQSKSMFNSGFFISLPFWWILLTVIYLLVLFITPETRVNYTPAGSIERNLAIVRTVGLYIGLFVPIGLWNLFVLGVSSNLITIIVPPLVLITIFKGDFFINKFNLSPITKIFVILLTLFFLTIGVDLILFQRWESLEFLKIDGKVEICGGASSC